jgi:hypothetical protein
MASFIDYILLGLVCWKIIVPHILLAVPPLFVMIALVPSSPYYFFKANGSLANGPSPFCHVFSSYQNVQRACIKHDCWRRTLCLKDIICKTLEVWTIDFCTLFQVISAVGVGVPVERSAVITLVTLPNGYIGWHKEVRDVNKQPIF